MSWNFEAISCFLLPIEQLSAKRQELQATKKDRWLAACLFIKKQLSIFGSLCEGFIANTHQNAGLSQN
jgi:hypothetical protein